MENLTCNLSGEVRTAKLYGRDHLIADATLIVPGVLNGSRGPLLYTPEDTAEGADAWNGMPILVYHPREGSGRNAEVLNRQGVGTVFNARFTDRLQAELWFDAERLDAVDPRVKSALNARQKQELSTGLDGVYEPAKEGAVFNGPLGPVPYTFIMRGHRPDHLAVLPDQKGACSLMDGCGVLNEESEPINNGGAAMPPTKLTEEARKEIIDGLVKNSCCWKEEDRKELAALTDNQLTLVKKASDEQAQNTDLLKAAEKGFNDGRDEITFNLEKKEWERKQKPQLDKKEEPVQNQAAEPTKKTQPTEEEWLAAAPQSVRNKLAYIDEVETKERKALIERITANVSNDAKPDKVAFLSKKELPELREIASLMPAPKQAAENYYLPQPAENAVPFTEEDHLAPPEYDWVQNSGFAKDTQAV